MVAIKGIFIDKINFGKLLNFKRGFGMKKRTLIYFVYMLIIIIFTAYFSFEIASGKFPELTFKVRQLFLGSFLKERRFELIDLPSLSKASEILPEEACKNIGIEAPHFPQNRFFEGYSENSLPPHGLLPGFEGIYDGTWICIPPTMVKINLYGLRDHEYSLEKPFNTFRIIVLGDSHTFGLGVELNETYPKVLEQLLNERDGGWLYEIINLGVPGYTMLEKVEFLKKKGVLFDPDLVMVQADLLMDDAWNRTEWNEFSSRYVEEFLIEHKLSRLELNRSFLELINYEAHDKYLEELMKRPITKILPGIKEPLNDLANITKRKGLPVVHLYLFHPKVGEKRIWKEIIESHGWHMFNFRFYNEYNKDSDLILHPKDPHPNALAHSLMAKEIYEWLISNNLIPT